MPTTIRARLALVIAVAVVLVAALTAGPRVASSQESGGGSAAASGGDDAVAGICAAPIDRCDDIVEGPVDDPSGCGVQTSGAGPDSAMSSDACHDGDRIADPGAGAQPVEPRPGMSGVIPRPFDRAVAADDGASVTVFFWSGVEPCYVLDHVDVTYNAHAVTITLFEGHDPQPSDVACIEIALLKKVVVALDEPLGDRVIVDGAA